MCVTGSLVQCLSGTFGVSKAANGVELVSPAQSQEWEFKPRHSVERVFEKSLEA